MTPKTAADFLKGGGEMGSHIRAYDWAAHPLGAPESWPQALKTAIRLILTTGHPMYVWWGPELYCFYNDAYRPSIGPERHPSSLGQPAREIWAEIWDVIGPQIGQVMSGGGSTWSENALIPITRNGRREDVYWTYSYSPIDDERAANGVGGVLVVCAETTAVVLAEKRKQDEATRQRRLFEQAPGFIIIMRGPRHIVEFCNNAHRTVFGSDAWIGKPIREAFPSIEGQGFFELLDGVYASGEIYEARSAEVQFQRSPDQPKLIRYLNFVYAPLYDDHGHVSGIFCDGWDVTDAHHAQIALERSEARLRFLDQLAAATGEQTEPESILAITTRMFGMHLNVSVCAYADMDPDEDGFTIRGDWAAPGAHSIVGHYSLTDFGALAVKNLHAGIPLVTNDNLLELGREDAALFLKLGLRATVCIPLIKQGCLTALMALHSAEPHVWKAEELSLLTEVAERSWAHIERVRSEAELREADRRKDEFIATLAHELRNPLAPIRSASHVAKSPNATEAQRRWSHDVIERQVAQMALLLDDLLDVSRITRGTLQLRSDDIELGAIVDTAIETATPIIDAKHHQLTIKLPDEPIRLHADPLRFSQILANLLTNAAKYSEPRSKIRLEAESTPHEIVISVADNGIGIDQQQLPKIFEMFSQGNAAIERSEGGLGIGLALVKGLVELHNGTIEARSPGPGQGSTFTIRVPKGATFAPAVSH